MTATLQPIPVSRENTAEPKDVGGIYEPYDDRAPSVLLTPEQRREKTRAYMAAQDAPYTARTMISSLPREGTGNFLTTAARLEAGFLERYKDFSDAKEALRDALANIDPEGVYTEQLNDSRDAFSKHQPTFETGEDGKVVAVNPRSKLL